MSKTTWNCIICDKELAQGERICTDNNDKCKKEYWGDAYYKKVNGSITTEDLKAKVLRFKDKFHPQTKLF